MQSNIYFPLQQLGYTENLYLTEQGQIVDKDTGRVLTQNKDREYKLTTQSGRRVYRRLKPLYRQAFGKEFAIDEIQDLPGEVWKPIDGLGKYFISNFGRVKSYQKYYAQVLKPYQNSRGYLRVDIKAQNRRTYFVHQLVARAFVPNDNPIAKDTVDHIDGDKTNNCANNLRWLSRLDNIKAYQELKKGKQENV